MLTARLDHVCPGQMDEAALLVAAPDGTAQPVRMVAFGQSNAATEAARHLYLMTSLTGPDWPPARLVQMYRTRWQIELAFKRLKSILHTDRSRPGIRHSPEAASWRISSQP